MALRCWRQRFALLACAIGSHALLAPSPRRQASLRRAAAAGEARVLEILGDGRLSLGRDEEAELETLIANLPASTPSVEALRGENANLSRELSEERAKGALMLEQIAALTAQLEEASLEARRGVGGGGDADVLATAAATDEHGGSAASLTPEATASAPTTEAAASK